MNFTSVHGESAVAFNAFYIVGSRSYLNFSSVDFNVSFVSVESVTIGGYCYRTSVDTDVIVGMNPIGSGSGNCYVSGIY